MVLNLGRSVPAAAGEARGRVNTREPVRHAVVVVGVGARTAVGMTAPATAAAVRAGIAGFEKHPFVVDTAGNPMIVAGAPYLGPSRRGGPAGGPGGTGRGRGRCRRSPPRLEASRRFRSSSGSARPPRPPEGPPDVVDPGFGRTGDSVPGGAGRGDRDGARGGGDGGESGVGGGPVRGCRVRPGRRGGFVPRAGNAGVAGGERAGPLGRAGQQRLGVHPGRGGRVRAARLRRRGRAVQAARGPGTADAATARETKLIKTEAVCIGEGLTALFRALAGVPRGRRSTISTAT